MSRLLYTFSFLFLLLPSAHCQVVGVKSNLLSDALASPNIGVEVGLSQRFTLEASVHYNGFDATAAGKRRKHWLVQPELRYWTCQAFGGHFLGVHAIYGWYNVSGLKLPFGLLPGLRDARYEGSLAGAGLSYGYQLLLSPRWSIEASLGVGMVHSSYERFRCFRCGEQTGSGRKNYVGPTKVAVSLVYLIK